MSDIGETDPDPSVPLAMASEPSQSFRADGYDYDHEVLVTLPPSYSVSPDRFYPVIWAMDGVMMHTLVAGIINIYNLGQRLPEMIVVSVGHRSEEGVAGFMKREFDLHPAGSLVGDDRLAEATLAARQGGADLTEMSSQFKGDKFLDFLINQLRPALTEKYRMKDDHALMGHSSGGYFTGFAMFAQPGGFSRYLIGSGCHPQTLALEAQYAESHDDLAARVFVGAGSDEVNNLDMAASRIVSRTVYFAENLKMRQYPSLSLKSHIYTDRDHFTVIPPMFADGLSYIYADEADKLVAVLA
jgi:predicted alpha/beta superfamily hydrolase